MTKSPAAAERGIKEQQDYNIAQDQSECGRLLPREKTSNWEGDPLGELTIPQTDTGEQVEYTRALERTIAGQLSWYGRTAAPREILLYTSSGTRFLNRTSIGERCKHREVTPIMLGLRANRAQYKRMELNLPLKKSICLTQAFRSHFLLKEDRKKLKVEKEGSDVYEQNEPQIEKADQWELQL
uniref:NAC domain-containing protein 41-like n=1 Tax=Tanacetum cinerariifolium TaxID=118510 RepID=A0A6L2M9Y5_TANCI|nr:NAC domain-containing protein 41-like [Tanacetum cinerariifolium]